MQNQVKTFHAWRINELKSEVLAYRREKGAMVGGKLEPSYSGQKIGYTIGEDEDQWLYTVAVGARLVEEALHAAGLVVSWPH